MAEFCLECWNKLNKTHDSRWRYQLSRKLYFCEGCSTYKKVIIRERIWSRVRRSIIKGDQ